MSRAGLYIHVPFCVRKCPYCDFYSLKFDSDTAEKYTDAVVRNIHFYRGKGYTADTLYFGGGTPSLLTAGQIGRIISAAREAFTLQNAEITLEANPFTVEMSGFFEELLSAGVNRLSLGIQSMNDRELKLLGRLHDAAAGERAIFSAHKAGFRNISADLMIGLPEQSAEDIDRSIEKLSLMPIEHISAYILKVESGTPFDCENIIRSLPDEDKAAELYLHTVEQLEKHGFYQYEISNFAKSGYESRHNLKYWLCEEYIGIGPSAHSCTGGKRYAVPPDIGEFISSERQGTYFTDEAAMGAEEFIMLRLRLMSGLDTEELRSRYSYPTEKLIKKARLYRQHGLIKIQGEAGAEVISLTPQGCLVSNEIIAELLC